MAGRCLGTRWQPFACNGRRCCRHIHHPSNSINHPARRCCPHVGSLSMVHTHCACGAPYCTIQATAPCYISACNHRSCIVCALGIAVHHGPHPLHAASQFMASVQHRSQHILIRSMACIGSMACMALSSFGTMGWGHVVAISIAEPKCAPCCDEHHLVDRPVVDCTVCVAVFGCC